MSKDKDNTNLHIEDEINPNIKWDDVDELAEARNSGKDIAACMGICYNTLKKYFFLEHKLAKNFDTFGRFLKYKRRAGNGNVKLAQYRKAKEGCKTLSIWWGKNYLGQTDRNEETHKGSIFHFTEESKGADKADPDEEDLEDLLGDEEII